MPKILQVNHRFFDDFHRRRTKELRQTKFGHGKVKFSESAQAGAELMSLIRDGLGKFSHDTLNLSLDLPAGWRVVPEAAPFALSEPGQRRTFRFMIHPPAKTSGGQMIARAEIGAGAAGRTVRQGVREIEYPHIPIQVVYPEAAMRVERTDVRLLSKRVGYIMGSGDKIPESIEQLGAEVTLLSDDDLAGGDLSRFDTVITGIRALNVRPAVYASRERLMDYVERGGTLVVQYNTLSRSAPEVHVLAPYPMTPSRDRVSREEARVRLIDPGHPLLTGPNRTLAMAARKLLNR